MGGCCTVNTCDVLIDIKEKEFDYQLNLRWELRRILDHRAPQSLGFKAYPGNMTELEASNTVQVHVNMKSVSSGSICHINIFKN